MPPTGVVDVVPGEVRRPVVEDLDQVTGRNVLATTVTTPAWSADGQSLIVVLTPDARGAEPKEPALASGPMVRINENNKLNTRSFSAFGQAE